VGRVPEEFGVAFHGIQVVDEWKALGKKVCRWAGGADFQGVFFGEVGGIFPVFFRRNYYRILKVNILFITKL
jgi:hypothetical protein